MYEVSRYCDSFVKMMFFKKKKLGKRVCLGQDYTLLMSHQKQEKKIRIINDTDYITHNDIKEHRFIGMWKESRGNNILKAKIVSLNEISDIAICLSKNNLIPDQAPDGDIYEISNIDDRTMSLFLNPLRNNSKIKKQYLETLKSRRCEQIRLTVL